MSQKGRPSLSQQIATEGQQADIEEYLTAGERGRMRASNQQRERFNELSKNGQLGANSRVGVLQYEISAALDKQKEKSKRKNAHQDENGPTPERAAKADGTTTVATPVRDRTTPALSRTHMLASPIDKFGPHWDPDIERTARDLRDMFLLAETGGSKVTSSYEGIPAGAFGSRPGGVADHIRLAQSIVTVIKSEFPSCIEDINFFITEIVVNQDGSSIRLEQAGAKHSPWKSPDARKGVAYGRLLKALEVLSFFLAKQREMGWGWGARPTNPDVARALQVELRARVQVMREQQARKDEDEKRRAKMIKGGK